MLDTLTHRIIKTAELATRRHDTKNVSLFNGLSAKALMYYELYNVLKDSNYINLCNAQIDLLLKNIRRCNYLNYSSGLAGILYLFCYLNNNGFCKDIIIPYQDLEKEYETILGKMYSMNNYDLQVGLIGIGVYYIERAKLNDCLSDKVYEVIQYLLNLRIESDDYAYWYYSCEKDINKNDCIVNLGFLHGMPSIIAFLIICCKEGYGTKLIQQTIKKGLLFLMSLMSEVSICYFPNYVSALIPPKKEEYFSPIAHCYGDLGIAHLFHQAYKFFHDEKYKDVAKKIYIKISHREKQILEIKNPYFCHGLSGIIYHLAYLEQGYSKYADCNIKQDLLLKLERITFEICRQNNQCNIGILNGMVGTVLSLLAIINDKNAFERILLLA